MAILGKTESLHNIMSPGYFHFCSLYYTNKRLQKESKNYDARELKNDVDEKRALTNDLLRRNSRINMLTPSQTHQYLEFEIPIQFCKFSNN